METEQKSLAANWNEVGAKKDGNKFFSPQPDRMYRVVFSNVVLERKAFKAEPMKLTASCTLKSIDGKPSDQIWETRSFGVMRELKKFVENEKWNGISITFLLKKKVEEGKTTYVFECIDGIEAMV
jgi:hypothetical protein